MFHCFSVSSLSTQTISSQACSRTFLSCILYSQLLRSLFSPPGPLTLQPTLSAVFPPINFVGNIGLGVCRHAIGVCFVKFCEARRAMKTFSFHKLCQLSSFDTNFFGVYIERKNFCSLAWFHTFSLVSAWLVYFCLICKSTLRSQ